MPRFSLLRLRKFGIIYLMASWRPLGGGKRPMVMLTVSRKGHVTSSLFRPGHGPRSKWWRNRRLNPCVRPRQRVG